MAFDVRVFGDGKMDDSINTYEIPANSEKVNIYDIAKMKAEFGFISVQAISDTDITINIHYSNWYKPTVLEEETWFENTSIAVSANTPILQQITLPFCKFVKFTVKNASSSLAKVAIHTVSA